MNSFIQELIYKLTNVSYFIVFHIDFSRRIKRHVVKKSKVKFNAFGLEGKMRTIPEKLSQDSIFTNSSKFTLMYYGDNPKPIQIETNSFKTKYSDALIEMIINNNIVRQLLQLRMTKKDFLVVALVAGTLGGVMVLYYRIEEMMKLVEALAG